MAMERGKMHEWMNVEFKAVCRKHGLSVRGAKGELREHVKVQEFHRRVAAAAWRGSPGVSTSRALGNVAVAITKSTTPCPSEWGIASQDNYPPIALKGLRSKQEIHSP